MAKTKKPVDVQKKKGNVVSVSDATNGKFKNKSDAILNKKQKNKKNKKAGGDNSPVKSAVLKEKGKTIIDVDKSNEPETKKSSPKKSKKVKNIIVEESVVGEILSNPKIAKKKLKKKAVVAAADSTTDTKKNPADEEQVEEKSVHKKPTKSDKKRKNSADEEQVEEKSVHKKPTKSDKKRKNSAGEAQVETEPKTDKKRKKSKTVEEDQEKDVSPKKKKSKETKTDETKTDETKDEAAKDKTPSVSVFVGNLPVNTKRGKILKLFSKFGKVKSIRFRLSNGVKFFKSQSKVTSPNVIAFVDYESEEEAKSSLVLNGEKIKDNVIRVNLQAKAKTADSFDGKRTVFVGNLKYCVTDQTLHDLFSCCGDIEYARTMQCDKGCNGIGYVCFKKSESIGMALELNNSDLQGRPIRVERYVKKTPGGPKEKKNKKEKPTGALRRLGKKQKVKTFKGKEGKEPNAKKTFAGVKAKDKKKFVKKNKKPLKGPKLLAKKIASRDKTTKAA